MDIDEAHELSQNYQRGFSTDLQAREPIEDNDLIGAIVAIMPVFSSGVETSTPPIENPHEGYLSHSDHQESRKRMLVVCSAGHHRRAFMNSQPYGAAPHGEH
ncbi:hypothetical protein [Janthinobacterium sp. RB2R34]|uniref:hypothetical protein n=1 Tax=Janthinobacterium sp. RB2R34 TaxID=3424193 RepID=UPI003F2243E5